MIAKAKARLEPAATADFQSGYSAALNSVDEKFYRELDWMAQHGLSLLRWAKSRRTSLKRRLPG